MAGWSHDGVMDWLKVNNFIRVNVHADGQTYDHSRLPDLSPITATAVRHVLPRRPESTGLRNMRRAKTRACLEPTDRKWRTGHEDWLFPVLSPSRSAVRKTDGSRS